METFDLVFLAVVLILIISFALVIARQRHMMRGGGGFPMALRMKSGRWLYGVGRYSGAELHWYRALGIGTRPTRVLHRAELRVVARRAPAEQERGAIPPTAVVLECVDSHGQFAMALGESAVTGFVSWLEASAPRF